MQARFAGSFCSLVLAWLCALGATSARHATVAPATARGAVEIVLREVAGAPQLASRVVVAAAAGRTVLERHASHRPAPTLDAARTGASIATAHRVALRRKGVEHARRAHWRAYDAMAPPLRSRFTLIARRV